MLDMSHLTQHAPDKLNGHADAIAATQEHASRDDDEIAVNHDGLPLVVSPLDLSGCFEEMQYNPNEARHLGTHVAVCAERYEYIHRRLRRLEYAVYGLLAILLANSDGPLTRIIIGFLK